MKIEINFSLFLFAISLSAGAEPVAVEVPTVWHCSKESSAMQEPLEVEDDDSFSFSSANENVISITLQDIDDLFGGRLVRLGEKWLTACFLRGDSDLNNSAFHSMGTNWTSLQSLSRRHSIRESKIVTVYSEEEMVDCIAENNPAVGYLSYSFENEFIASCF